MQAHNDSVGVLTGLAAALKIAAPNIWAELSGTLRSIQSPPIEPAMALILDGLSLVPNPFVLVLDDCHMVRAQPIKRALELLVEHLPSQAQLVMAIREDPPLPRQSNPTHLGERRSDALRNTPIGTLVPR